MPIYQTMWKLSDTIEEMKPSSLKSEGELEDIIEKISPY